MSFKLLALDLDDTLLNETFCISRENRDAINRAVRQGVLVTLATGRMFRSALPYAKELKIDLPLITYHGALVRTAMQGETLYHRPVPLHLAKRVIAYCEERGFHMNVYVNDELFVACENENDYSRYYQSIANVKVTVVGDLQKFLQMPPTKLTVINREGLLLGLIDKLKKCFGTELSIRLSKPHFLEITDCMATKGEALKSLAALHHIPQEQVAAIGDSYNDVDMLIYAGIGVAVNNAPADVKAVADVITSSNVEHGVAAFIQDYLFGGRRIPENE